MLLKKYGLVKITLVALLLASTSVYAQSEAGDKFDNLQLTDENIAVPHIEPAPSSPERVSAAVKQDLKGLIDQANSGDSEAQLKLAVVYNQGIGVEKNTALALEYMRKSADGGYAPALVAMGNYEFSHKNFSEALGWYVKAAQKRDPDGSARLAMMYENGAAVQKDDVQAAAWYGEALKLGNALAGVKLGMLYSRGTGVTKDQARAVSYWQAAADKNIPIAQFLLGRAYHLGEGINQSDDDSIVWLKKAALSGMPQAQFWIGTIYEHGLNNAKTSSPPDIVNAIAYYALSATQGYPLAMQSMSAFFLKGEGVVQNIELAFSGYTIAAKNGLAVSQYNLAHMYEIGLGTKQDREMAKKYYGMAAKQGFAQAKEALDRISKDSAH